jgi:hypothetical protein
VVVEKQLGTETAVGKWKSSAARTEESAQNSSPTPTKTDVHEAQTKQEAGQRRRRLAAQKSVARQEQATRSTVKHKATRAVLTKSRNESGFTIELRRSPYFLSHLIIEIKIGSWHISTLINIK